MRLRVAFSWQLLKISGQMEQVPRQDLRHAEMNAFYIFPVATKDSFMNLFSTHPPMDKRIEALARMESELQGTAGRAVPVTV